jgi:hypothetical protein
VPAPSGFIEVRVPASFADREWRAFIGRSVYDRYHDLEEYHSFVPRRCDEELCRSN